MSNNLEVKDGNANAPALRDPQTNGDGRKGTVPEASTKVHGRFSPLWLIPIVAAALVIYLGVHSITSEGPTITLTFKTAAGLVAGQTQVHYKDVNLGTVNDVVLASDYSHVIVKVQLNGEARELVTDHARFWVVRPRFGAGGLAGITNGLETLVSGAYIQVDPGTPGGKKQRDFTGLEDPPSVRSDQPGRTFVLHSKHLGSLSAGAPIFFRDITVGEVLGYDIGDGAGDITLRIFVSSPYDKFVHADTRFYNASGLSVGMGADGLKIELESIQALLSGGIAFEARPHTDTEPASAENQVFTLYDDKASADAAQYTKNYHFVTYFETSIEGLSRASSVQIFGVQVGTVRDIAIVYDAANAHMRVRVAFDVQPERVTPDKSDDDITPDVMQKLVAKGLRVVLDSPSLITGQKVISLQYVPGSKKTEVGFEGDAMVVPSQAGGLDGITSALSDVAAKLDKIPFEEIGNNVNETLITLNKTVGGPDMKNALAQLSQTMTQAKDLVTKANAGATPLLQRLPAIAEQMQQAVERANAAFGANGYGENSDMHHGLQQLLSEATDTARSVRLLADFLDRHPESLLQGRPKTGGK
ncbi:MAG: MlaD family protein [Polyangiaceae bacterium]